MAVLFEGDCIGYAVDVEVGKDNSGRPRVKWEMEVLDGPHVGRRASYSGKLDKQSIKFTRRDMIAIGWKGKDVRTFVDDVKAAKRKVPFKAEIAEFTRLDGSISRWTSAKFGGAMPLAALDKASADELNTWLNDANDGDVPASTTAADDESIPF